MKLAACFLLSVLALCSQQPPAAPTETKPEDRCAVEGQVLSSATGEPIRKAELALHGTEPSRGGMPVTYSGASDAAGKFTIADVEPGKYHLLVHRTGFVDMQYGARGPGRPGTTLSLRPGQRLKDTVFRLIPHAVIAGRIVDEDDEPAVSVAVQAMRYRYLTGKRQLVNAGFAHTNDLGEYRIYGLAPGRYYLVAEYVRFTDGTAVDRTAVPAAESYVPTYYPGTPDAATAATVEAGPGMQLRGVNFALSKAKTVRVRGHLNNLTGAGRQNVILAFFPRGQSRFMSMNPNHMTDSRGDFEINGVRPGTYTLEANLWAEDNIYSARQEVAVGESNVDNLVVTLAPGADLSGQFVVEGTAQPDLSGVSVYLRSHEDSDFGSMAMARSVTDNAFTISNVGSEVYSLQVGRLPDGYWIKSVRMGEEEVRISGIDLTRGQAAPLIITIAPNAGQIDGAVIDGKQQPAAGASVVLVPEPKLRDQDWAYKTTTSDQNGRFSLKNLDPGEYKLFAWEDVEYGEYMDPDFLKPVEDRGQDVSVHEGSRESVQLNLIPAESASKVQKEDK